MLPCPEEASSMTEREAIEARIRDLDGRIAECVLFERAMVVTLGGLGLLAFLAMVLT